MAITAASAPTTTKASIVLQTATPKTGTHTHQCYEGHVFVCVYTTSCALEMIVGPQDHINRLCPVCHNYGLGQYGS